MPQFMQRAAWSRVSFSESGTTNSLKCPMRSATGVYFRSCRSISRKPVTLPIENLTPLHHSLVFVVFVIARSEAAKQSTLFPWKDFGLLRCARNGGVCLRSDRDLRLGVGVGAQFAQRAAVLDRHHLAEFRQPMLPVR